MSQLLKVDYDLINMSPFLWFNMLIRCLCIMKITTKKLGLLIFQVFSWKNIFFLSYIFYNIFISFYIGCQSISGEVSFAEILFGKNHDHSTNNNKSLLRQSSLHKVGFCLTFIMFPFKKEKIRIRLWNFSLSFFSPFSCKIL